MTDYICKLGAARGGINYYKKKRHSQECLPLAAESAAPTTSSYDD